MPRKIFHYGIGASRRLVPPLLFYYLFPFFVRCLDDTLATIPVPYTDSDVSASTLLLTKIRLHHGVLLAVRGDLTVDAKGLSERSCRRYNRDVPQQVIVRLLCRA
jgi:hypothetical protein